MIFDNKTSLILILGAALSLGACSGANMPKGEAKYPTGMNRDQPDANDIYGKRTGIFGEGGILGKKKQSDAGQSGIGVNSFLWRAALDTISFMPLASADPFGGVILTDWYSAPETPNERMKLNVFILDKQLRSDGIQVKVFRQTRKGKGDWRDAEVAEGTARGIEDAILTRARQMRASQIGEIKE